jgi:hypothetical protein
VSASSGPISRRWRRGGGKTSDALKKSPAWSVRTGNNLASTRVVGSLWIRHSPRPPPSREGAGTRKPHKPAARVSGLTSPPAAEPVGRSQKKARSSLLSERKGVVDVVSLAKALPRKKPKSGKLSLRAISAALAEVGHVNERGKPFNPKSLAGELMKGISDRVVSWRSGILLRWDERTRA